MSFVNRTEHDEGINEINMTPLVDVMLVLLIIFIVTIPVVRQSLDIDLPDEVAVSIQEESETIVISINASGEYYLNGLLMHDEELRFKFNAIAQNRMENMREQIPTVQIHGDKDAKYARIALVMSMAQQSGMHKIGFVMDDQAKDETN